VPETSPALGRPRWAPDITVDAPLAARVIAEQFRELAGLPVVQIGAGWDNAVFSVGPDWVFRFIHRQTAVQGSAAEVAVLRALPQDLPLPVPRPLFIGTPTDELPWPFWGGPLLRVDPWSRATPREVDPWSRATPREIAPGPARHSAG